MTDDGFVSFMGTRHQVMVHIAMHDALNAIRPRFDQYAYFGRSTRRDPDRGRREGGTRCPGRRCYPAQQATLDAELATWLATVPNGSGKTKALALGAKAAAAIVALRQNDGTDIDLVSPNYTPGTQQDDFRCFCRAASPSRRLSISDAVRLKSPEAFRCTPARR